MGGGKLLCNNLKTHLYALLVIIGHDSDALMSDADIGGNAILYHGITSLNNLDEKHSDFTMYSAKLNVGPTTIWINKILLIKLQ